MIYSFKTGKVVRVKAPDTLSASSPAYANTPTSPAVDSVTIPNRTTHSPSSAPVQETPPIPTAAPLPKISLTSIRTNLKEQARLQQEARKTAQANRREVTMDNLKPAWEEAVNKIAADKGMYKASLLLSDLQFENPTIRVSALLSCYDFIRQRRLELLDFFKNYYSDETLNVILETKADEEPKERILSTREVFEEMARKNPALRALKEQLGLDLEL